MLENVDDNLTLISHAEFDDHIASMSNSSTYPNVVWQKYIDSDQIHRQHSNEPCWDLIIADDWDYLSCESFVSLEYLTEISHKTIILTSDNYYSSVHQSNPTLIKNEASQLSAPSGQLSCARPYKQLHLTQNVRSSCEIVNYLKRYSKTPISTEMSERGQVLEITTCWTSLNSRLYRLIKESLQIYCPSQILIIVDAELKLPNANSTASKSQIESNVEIECLTENLSGALLLAVTDANSNSTLEYSERLDAAIDRCNAHSRPVLIATNGHELKLCKLQCNQHINFESAELHGNDYRHPDVDAQKLLHKSSLCDPNNKNAIFILQTQLSIGMEAELVIYIRNENENNLETCSINDESADRIGWMRDQSHMAAMSCANHQLIDLRIQ